MHNNISIRLKAAFLTIIFSLNILISLGCSLGLCNCCTDEAAEKTVQKIESPCHHPEAVTKPVRPKDCDRDCCNDTIVKLAKADKSFPPYYSAPHGKFISFIPSRYDIPEEYISKGHAGAWRYFLNHHPPIPDIRITIQSFQI